MRVAELFAGVGGFHVGLSAAGHEVVWANQWEPSRRVQHAADIYRSAFPDTPLTNESISSVLDRLEAARGDGFGVIPDFDLLCGGFPCQDYSVAKPSALARGLAGQKGALWWDIVRVVKRRLPRLILLENVDRLLKSPAAHRGRDFAVILSTLNDLGYVVEWRVINAADYGFPQRRRRAFILAYPRNDLHVEASDLVTSGYFAQAFPIQQLTLPLRAPMALSHALPDLQHDSFQGQFDFLNTGVASDRKVWTADTRPMHAGSLRNLRSILQRDQRVPDSFFIPEEHLERWRYVKGAKRELRTSREGFQYEYVEGAMVFPDPRHLPSRTILTAEGGSSPSRFRHVIETAARDRFRRLTPIELERLNGFPDNHTAIGTSGPLRPAARAFLMGNALVTGVPQRLLS
jgi:DNA (cytosine-5)-methyltransferase 1